MDPLEALTSPDRTMNRYSPMVSELPEGLKRAIRFIFGDAVSFDEADRYMYAKDPSDLPRTSGPLPDLEKVLRTKPHAVVRARNHGDLLELVKLGNRFNLPLVPRGGGTSTYGASTPAEGGISVDLTGLRSVLSIDKEKREVDVECGMKLWELQRILEAEGLSLRVVPQTALGATVGGAIGANVAGYGSAKYGRFGDAVLEVEMLSADQKLRTLRGGELDLAVGAEGSTGFLLRARLSVVAKQEIVPLALAFDDLEGAAKAASVFAGRYPVHSANLYTSSYLEMRQEAGEKKTIAPTKTGLLLGLSKDDHALHKDALKADAERFGGQLLDDKIARAEWDARFHLWVVKRAGPSLVLVETILPLSEVARAVPAMLANVSTETRGAFGQVVGSGEMLVTVAIPEDERRPEHATSLGEMFALHRIARKHGGRPYVHGYLLAHEARESLRGQHELIVDFKAKTDPNEIFNPGKMVPARMKGLPFARVSTFLALNAPLMAQLRGLLTYRGPEREDTTQLGVHAAIGRVTAGGVVGFHHEMTSCSSCGICNAVCPVWSGEQMEGQLPRGHVWGAKAVLENEASASERLQLEHFECTLCGLCEDACSSKIPLVAGFVQFRQDLVETLGALPAHGKLALSAAANGNIVGKPRADRANWTSLPEGVAALSPTPGAGTLLFAGCRAAYGHPASAQAAAKLLEAAGVAWTHLGAAESCCGHTLLWTGQYDAARPHMEANVKAILQSGASLVVTPDAECARAMKTHYAAVANEMGYDWNVQVQHVSEVLAPQVKSGRVAATSPPWGKVLALPACMRSDEGATVAALSAVKGMQLEIVRGNCCGAGGGVREQYPQTAERIAARILTAAKAQGASTVVGCAPICSQHLGEVNRKLKTGLAVLDAQELLAQAAGLLPKPAAPAAKPGAKPAAEKPAAVPQTKGVETA